MWLDEDVSDIILATAKGDPDSRLQTMTTVILSYAFERFEQVEKEKPRPTSYTMNRRAARILHLHQELCTLRKQYKAATFSRADKHPAEETDDPSQSRVAPEKRESQEASSLHRQSLWLHETTPRGQAQRRLQCSLEQLNHFLQDTVSDPLREQDLEPNKAVISPDPPTTQFNLKEPGLKEVEEIIQVAAQHLLQQHSLPALQTLPRASIASVEASEGELEKGEGG